MPIEKGNIICFGVDPILEKIPFFEESAEKTIEVFYKNIFDGFIKNNIMPASVKPNIAFFEQYGIGGLQALKNIIKMCKAQGVQVIMDCKRGDVGNTSKAYAKAMFDFWEADAITVSPYMGFESIEPFLTHSKDKGVYILCKTSNDTKEKGSLQSLVVDGEPLYKRVAENIFEWSSVGGNDVGAVVGGNDLDALKSIDELLNNSGKEIPLLIPGIGAQGGSKKDVLNALKTKDIRIHRINSSSFISYAYLNNEKYDSTQYVEAAVEALKELIGSN